jgi:uncharacterized membrane protein
MPTPRVARRQVLTKVADSLWVVPAAYIAGALALATVLVRWDESDPVELSSSLSAGSASTALAALGSGMLAFTGFVTSVVLVLVQFGTSEFSPRLVRWLRRDRTLKFALSTFVATFAAAKHLADGRVRDHRGTTRLVYPTPVWEDLVALALDEIRAFGAGQYQIVRRVRALLDALLDDVPERRRPALLAQRALLDDAVVRRFPEDQRADALVADRQGLGMSRRLGATGSDRRSAEREISSRRGDAGPEAVP